MCVIRSLRKYDKTAIVLNQIHSYENVVFDRAVGSQVQFGDQQMKKPLPKDSEKGFEVNIKSGSSSQLYRVLLGEIYAKFAYPFKFFKFFGNPIKTKTFYMHAHQSCTMNASTS
jgi:hypothetical protein